MLGRNKICSSFGSLIQYYTLKFQPHPCDALLWKSVQKRVFFLLFYPLEEWVALAHEKINVALPVMRQVKSKMMENWERQYDLYWLTRNWRKEEEERKRELSKSWITGGT